MPKPPLKREIEIEIDFENEKQIKESESMFCYWNDRVSKQPARRMMIHGVKGAGRNRDVQDQSKGNATRLNCVLVEMLEHGNSVYFRLVLS